MIKPLRKRHLQIWTLLALLLPLGIISAWLVIPKAAIDKTLQPAKGSPLPVLIKTFKADKDYTMNIRTSADSSAMQLEWVNEKILTSPSALIYQKQNADSSNSITDADLIGRIDNRGRYYFPLKNTKGAVAFHFIIYDIIHHHVIYRINF
jgi:hypothetical protein